MSRRRQTIAMRLLEAQRTAAELARPDIFESDARFDEYLTNSVQISAGGRRVSLIVLDTDVVSASLRR